MARVRLPAPGFPMVMVEPEHGLALSALDTTAILALYKAHGALLFRGFDCELPQFREFAWRFCSTAVVNEVPNRTPLDPGGFIYSVDGGDNEFSLHPELARTPWKPDLAMFGCLFAPGAGGETTICDGTELVRALPAEVRDGLTGRRLVYGLPTWPALLQFWLGSPDPDDATLHSPPPGCPFRFERLDDNRILRLFSRPALHKPMFADELAFGNFLLFARFNNGRSDFPLLDDLSPVPEEWLQAIKATGDALGCAISWQQGDVLMLDNTRFMHGRRAIHDAQERTIATFFGYLNFAEPDREEPPNPIWRRENFVPPTPPEHLIRRA